MLRNEAQCDMKNISVPGQFNRSSFSGREESCPGLSHITKHGTGLCKVFTIKMSNSGQSEKAKQSQCVSLSRPFPSKRKKKSQKRSKRSQEESQVQSRAILEPWSLESCQASWQEVRRACDGNLPCVSSEVHSNRDTSAQHFAYNKSALSDKNLG